MNGIELLRQRLELVRPAADVLAGVKCLRCRDRGYCIQVDSNDIGAFVHGPCPECEAGKLAAQQQMQAKLDALFAESKLPTMYRSASLADFDGSPALRKQVEDALADGRGLLLWGTYGTGTTHLAAAVMRQKLAEGTPGLFIKTPTLLNRLRSTFDRDASGPTAADLLAAVKAAPLLILDDLGTEKPSEWVLETLFEVIDSRYCECRPLIATTNLDAAALKHQLGPRLVSRLAQMCAWIAMNGQDRRLGR